MDVFIHIGCHKTATSSFQTLASSQIDSLSKLSIFYPNSPSCCHKEVSRELEFGNLEYLSVLANRYIEVNNGKGVLLISSEDLEGLLIYPNKALLIENLLYKSGYKNIYWYLTSRIQFEYFESLYSELSKGNGLTVEYRYLAECILKYGYYEAMLPKGNISYIFDYKRFIPPLFKSY